MPRVLKIILVALAAVLVLVVGGTWLYINVLTDDAPEELSFTDRDQVATTAPNAATAGTTAVAVASTASGGAEASDGVEGDWVATPESIVGYRVKEILFGQDTEGVGRTSQVTGDLTISGTDVTAVRFEVDMGSVESDQSRRDNQFRGRIMDVEQFPTASFTLTEPIALGTIPADQEVVTAEATGDLTLRGTTASVTFPVQARRNGSAIEVDGSIPIVFADWGIPNPSFGPVTTEDNGLLEFLLVFQRP